MSAVVPLTTSRHGRKYWRRFSSYHFAGREVLVSLMLAEMGTAVLSLPVAFVPRGEAFVPAAVLGFVPGRNLLVGPQGNWLAAYVPAPFRCHPFKLAESQGQMVLCVDEGSELLNEDGQGEALFTPEGKVSAALQGVMDFFQAVGNSQPATARACALLQEHGLIVPWPAQVQLTGGVTVLEGLFQVDHEALGRVSAEVLKTLQDSGALWLAHCQLLSRQHLATLAQLARKLDERAAHADRAAPLPEKNGALDLSFMKDDGLLDFGHL